VDSVSACFNLWFALNKIEITMFLNRLIGRNEKTITWKRREMRENTGGKKTLERKVDVYRRRERTKQ
jgi:hypothetical protein